MQYSIRKTDHGWELVDGDGVVVATFTGTDEQAYNDAVAHLGTLVQRAVAADDQATTPADDAPAAAPVQTDEGLLPETWTDVNGIAFCNTLPGGRDFTNCTWSWRDPEACLVPLMLQTANEGGHFGAELAGFITQFELTDDGQTVHASGRFYDNAAGQQARDLLLDGRKFGVSVDPSEAVTVDFECTEMDEMGWCMAGLDKFLAYEIAGLTMVPFPGFEEAAIKLAASRRAMFVTDGRASLMLAGAPMPDMQPKGEDDNADDSSDDGGKKEPAEVNYKRGEDGSTCADCTNYTDGDTPHCSLVDDPIFAEGTCDLFDDAADEGSPTDDDDTADDADDQQDAPPVRASISVPNNPPRAWFELAEPAMGVEWFDGRPGDELLVPQRRVLRNASGQQVGLADDVLGMAVPFTITDDSLVYGHLTYWGQCHVGNPWGAGRCASAQPSSNGYADFHGSGYVQCDDGSELSVGLLHVGCEHSEAMDVRGVRDAAAHAGLAFARVRVVDGEYGPWVCGSLLPTVTDEQVEKLRALTLSGEWAPELGAVIAVNDGGLPLQRADRIAASTGAVFPIAQRTLAITMEGGAVRKMVGGNPVHRCPECARRAATQAESTSERRLTAIEQQLDLLLTSLGVIEARTRHLNAAAAEALRRQLASQA